MSGRDRVVSLSDLGADEIGLSLLLSREVGLVLSWWSGAQVGKVFLGQLDQLVVRHATGTDKDHPIRRVIGFDVVDQIVSGDALDVLARPEDRSAEGLVHVGRGMQVVKDDLFELFVDFFGFSKDDIALPLDRGMVNLGVLQNVRQDIDRLLYIGVERFGIVDRVLSLTGVSRRS